MVIFQNTIDAMDVILRTMKLYDIKFSDPTRKVAFVILKNKGDFLFPNIERLTN